MAVLRDVVVDCVRPAPLARWWAATLDGYRVAPYDDAELARLRALGVDDPDDDPSVLVEPVPTGEEGSRAGSATGVRLWFTAVPEPRSGKNRVHLDVAATDVGAEVAALVVRGARELARHEGWVVLADPEGNEFCVVPA